MSLRCPASAFALFVLVSSAAAMSCHTTLDLGDDLRDVDEAGVPPDGGTPSDAAVGSDVGVDADASRAGSPSDPAELAVGLAHVCALFDDGSVGCWGMGAFGQLGPGITKNRGDAPGQMGAQLPRIPLGTSAIAIAAGGYHTCALLLRGQVACWGSNDKGQLGLSDPIHGAPTATGLQRVDLGSGRTATAIFAGGNSSCAILDDSSVKCWGQNAQGQLGLGDVENRGDVPNEMGDALPSVALGTARHAKALTVGNAHVCAILDDDSVKCWGSNVGGGLGLGDTNARGDGPNEMGDALPAVDLGPGRKAKGISAGATVDHTCALLDDDSLKCWGFNSFTGNLGLGDSAHRGDAPNEMGANLPALDFGPDEKVAMVSGGRCVVLSSGALKCWGANANGELGLGDTSARGASASQMGSNLPPVDLGTTSAIRKLHAYTSETCVLFADRRVRCFGANGSGQLGIGDNAARGDGPGEMGASLPFVDLGN